MGGVTRALVVAASLLALEVGLVLGFLEFPW